MDSADQIKKHPLEMNTPLFLYGRRHGRPDGVDLFPLDQKVGGEHVSSVLSLTELCE